MALAAGNLIWVNADGLITQTADTPANRAGIPLWGGTIVEGAGLTPQAPTDYSADQAAAYAAQQDAQYFDSNGNYKLSGSWISGSNGTVGSGRVDSTLFGPGGFGTGTGGSATLPTDDTMDPAKKDAIAIITALFESYGLGTLAPKIIEYVKAGYSADAVSVLLQQTPEYKTRFAANETRRAAGKNVLSPAEYLATENAYRQVMQKWGLPAGFYDQTSDFTDFIAKDVSPSEIDSRASSAMDFINRNDPQQLAYFRNWYTNGDMIAFALDPTKAAPLVGKAFQSSMIGGVAATEKVAIDKTMAERLAGDNISLQQAQQGFGSIGQDAPTAKTLGEIYNIGLTPEELTLAMFEGDAAANQKRNLLASKERATFGGKPGAGASALSKSGGI